MHRRSFLGRAIVNPSATNFSCLRLLLIRDMENPGSDPAATDIFETVSGAVTTRSSLNYTNRTRFSVLFDEYIIVDKVTNWGNPIRAELNLERHIKYRGSGATSASAAEGALYWVAVSDETTNNPGLAIYLQFEYTDD